MPLIAGDVIKTHPRESCWGCAVVLSTGGIGGLDPMCHIGVTPIVFERDYEWRELDVANLSILVIDRPVRIGVNTYASRRETCIGIYTTRPHPRLPVIGHVDPTTVSNEELNLTGALRSRHAREAREPHHIQCGLAPARHVDATGYRTGGLMTAGEPLHGPDISDRLRSSRGFGVTAAQALDDVPTIELTTDPTIHGPRAQINIRRAGPDDRLKASFGTCGRGHSPSVHASLVARLQVGDRSWVQCASQDSIRFWGRFGPSADLVVESSFQIRLVARTPAGEVLAGPVTLAHESPITLTWPAEDAPAT